MTATGTGARRLCSACREPIVGVRFWIDDRAFHGECANPTDTRTGYTTVDPSEGEQAKPCYPDPVMDAVRRCAEIVDQYEALAYDGIVGDRSIREEKQALLRDLSRHIRREFGLLPTSET